MRYGKACRGRVDREGSIMRWEGEVRGVGLPVKLRRRVTTRPSLGARAIRAADRFVTRTQEWLETDDRAGQKFVAYMLTFLFLVYMVCAVIRFLG
jgi:hypothetical protein